MTARNSSPRRKVSVSSGEANWPNINIHPRLSRPMQSSRKLRGEDLMTGQRRYLHSLCSIYSVEEQKYQLRAASMDRLKRAYFFEYPGCDDFIKYARWILHPHKQLFVTPPSVKPYRNSSQSKSAGNESSRSDAQLSKRSAKNEPASARKSNLKSASARNYDNYSDDFESNVTSSNANNSRNTSNGLSANEYERDRSRPQYSPENARIDSSRSNDTDNRGFQSLFKRQ